MSNTPERDRIIRILCDTIHLNWSRPDIEDAADRILSEDRPTLRDQFAMAAMQAVITRGTKFADADIGMVSYEMADVMLEARKQ